MTNRPLKKKAVPFNYAAYDSSSSPYKPSLRSSPPPQEDFDSDDEVIPSSHGSPSPYKATPDGLAFKTPYRVSTPRYLQSTGSSSIGAPKSGRFADRGGGFWAADDTADLPSPTKGAVKLTRYALAPSMFPSCVFQ